ncbi:hypothetical protein [Larkinella sp.]|uniref:hypothetical protein n=1 Tax=Larkinella sp. TaxID=2034517 RepID=UPI003BA98984
MFSIGDLVICNCGIGGIPVGTQGIIKNGPITHFGKTLYAVKCRGFASSLQLESCLSRSEHNVNAQTFFEVGDIITLKSSSKSAKKGTQGVVVSAPRSRAGKVVYDIFLDGNVNHVTIQEGRLETKTG